MLCQSQKVKVIGLLNETKHRKIKLNLISSCCLILLNSASDTNSSVVICADNFMFIKDSLAGMQVVTEQT